MKSLLFILVVGFATHVPAAELPTGGSVVNIVEWDGAQLPPVYERSDQMPLTEDEVLVLSNGGFASEQLVTLLTERRYAGDASAAGLLKLRRLRVDDAVLTAVSRHGLPPNRSIDVTISLAFEGEGGQAGRQRYLYAILPDGDTERVLTADLASVLGGSWTHETRQDHSDMLLPRPVRTVRFTSRLPLKQAGTRKLAVLVSTRPDIQRVSEIPPNERDLVRYHDLDYPASSLARTCKLDLRFKRDVVLPDQWQLTSTRLECEWN
tara:strand:- start:657 stop:1448 length:792 start_codon:yes stop_codon:yes gene_type:complete